MSNIKLHTSNRLEALADSLAELVSVPMSSPFKSEAIVVQSKGMERWISMQLAERLGIWSNCKYYFPNQIVMEIFRLIAPEIKNERIFNTSIITWQIMKILPECILKSGYETLGNYLNSSDISFKSYLLSEKIADTFDQYLTYRPDMIISWENEKEKHWQADMWRRLKKELSDPLPPHLRKLFLQSLKKSGNLDFKKLPERINIFGISSMPSFHLDILSAVSDNIEINFFFMNPSKEYWVDIFPDKSIAKTLEKYDSEITSGNLHLEKGNSLLASMGELGKDFLSVLLKNDIQEFPGFVEPGFGSLLCSVQSDILTLTDRGLPGSEQGCIEISVDKIKSDDSVRVHSCHSPMREIEVLFDNMLNMFSKDHDLEPRDIIVMMPDIEVYSPYISAIFNLHSNENQHIPFSIADRSIRKESVIIDVFFSLLNLNESRFEAGKVIDILRCEAVQQKFDLLPGDITLIRKWIKDTNIKWGVDKDYREKYGLPAFDENTWKTGIERMLLGYAMPESAGNMYNNILPYDIEGNESQILGRFTEFYTFLKRTLELISDQYSLSEWSRILKEILNSLFKSDFDPENYQLLIEAISGIEEIEIKSGFTDKVELKIIISCVENFLNEKQIQIGFLTGSVTFCAMLPMRSIPFKIICLLGMNDNAFPRNTVSTAFNLITQDPMEGDRSRRKDDRYLFLEAIISARKNLYISYVGQSIQDNTEISPSVVVSELLDYIREGYKVPKNNILDFLLVKHPLQSFSAKYFKDNENIFSFSNASYLASIAASGERKQTLQFIDGKLSETFEWPKEKAIELKELIKFFNNPAKYLLMTKLGIYLEDFDDTLDDKEPFDLKGLGRYQVEDFISDELIHNNKPLDLYGIFRAKGMLPHGNIGKSVFNNLLPGIKYFSERIKLFSGEIKLKPLKIDLNLSGYNLSGVLDNLWTSGMILYRYAEIKAKDRLKSWISHLVLNSVKSPEYPSNSILICKDTAWEMDSIQSMDLLKTLIEIYIKGNNELLFFFPEASFEYVSTFKKKNSQTYALRQAEKKWTGNDYEAGEGDNPYYDLCFGRTNPINKYFADISTKVFEALINNQKLIEI